MDNVVLSPQMDGARTESPQALLDCGGMDFIDSQGPAKMREISKLTEQPDVALRLARVRPAVRELLARDGLLADL
jgi:anti-anti-sigma regulatory factor